MLIDLKACRLRSLYPSPWSSSPEGAIVIYKRNLSRWCGSESARCDCDSRSSSSIIDIDIQQIEQHIKDLSILAEWIVSKRMVSSCVKCLLCLLCCSSHWNVIFCELCRDGIQLEKLLKHLINWNWIDYMKVASKIRLSICPFVCEQFVCHHPKCTVNNSKITEWT